MSRARKRSSGAPQRRRVSGPPRKPAPIRVHWLEGALRETGEPAPVLIACALLSDDDGVMRADEDELYRVTVFVGEAIGWPEDRPS